MRWILLACLLSAAAPAAAQPPPGAAAPTTAVPSQAGPAAGAATYVGKPIEQVQVFVEGQPTADAALTDLLETRVGSPLSMADVRESIAHLYSLGRFQDVRVDASRRRPAASRALRPRAAPQRAAGRLRRHARPRQGPAAAHDRRSLRREAAGRARGDVARHARSALPRPRLPGRDACACCAQDASPSTSDTVLTFEIELGPRRRRSPT